MIQKLPPKKTILISDFKVRHLNGEDYTWNSEFEQSFKDLFDVSFRVIEFQIPEDASLIESRIYHLDGIDIYPEFTKYNKSKNIIGFVCEGNKLDSLKEIHLSYYFLHPELVEIQRQVKELEDKFEKRVKEINESTD